jgi:hypothetical protein
MSAELGVRSLLILAGIGSPEGMFTGVQHRGLESAKKQKCRDLLKGKCALGPFLSILVIECKHKGLNVKICSWMNKV